MDTGEVAAVNALAQEIAKLTRIREEEQAIVLKEHGALLNSISTQVSLLVERTNGLADLTERVTLPINLGIGQVVSIVESGSAALTIGAGSGATISGGAFYLRGSVTSTNTVTVYVCGTGTPSTLAYNVAVF